MILNKPIQLILVALILVIVTINPANAAPLKFKVTFTGSHDIDWTYHLKMNTGTDGYVSDLPQEGSEFVDYVSSKPVIMIFKNKPGVGLVGTVKGTGIDKYPYARATITNDNVSSYSCSGKCPPAPDLTPLRSGCGSKSDLAHIKLTYDSGTFEVQSLRISDLGALPGGTQIPPSFDPSLYYLPVGTLYPNFCGPSFPPNNPAQDLVDYRYPFIFETNSDILPGKPSTAVDNKLKKLKVGKTLTVKFGYSITPSKTLLFDGNGFTYSAETAVFWTLKLKRLA
jgi:hypothetical protein